MNNLVFVLNSDILELLLLLKFELYFNLCRYLLNIAKITEKYESPVEKTVNSYIFPYIWYIIKFVYRPNEQNVICSKNNSIICFFLHTSQKFF